MSSVPKLTSELQQRAALDEASAAGLARTTKGHGAGNWQVLWRFAIHVCIGSFLFSIVAVPAILLNWFIQWVESVHPTDLVIILGLRVAEYAIFSVDSVLLLNFLMRTAKRTIREM